MAMSIPKVGFSRMLKEGAKHFRGIEESVIRNIQACTELVGSVRSSFGPNDSLCIIFLYSKQGMNKMIINHLEKLYVTSDAATIVKELEIAHPAAKMLILASQMQEHEVGDGTNLVLIIAGALLEHAEELLRMGLTPTEIVSGYETATKKCLEILPELVCDKVESLRNTDGVRKAVRSSLMAKQYGNEDFLADLVIKACTSVLPKNEKNFNVDNVRVCKILGSGLHGSTVLQGMVFKRGIEGDVKKVENGKVVVFTCPFDLTQTETKGTVAISTAKELLNFSKDEEAVVEQQVKQLADAGVTVVVSGGKFGDLYTHFLNKYKIMAIRLNSKFDVRRLCKTVGATALPTIITPSSAEVGVCSHVYADEIGGTEVVVFRQDTDGSSVATIVIRGSTDNLMDDIERAIDDGVNTFKALSKDGRLVPGAGATEIELARRIESFAQVCPGLEQYSIQKFAESLETIPKILAENAGVKATEILSKLYASHQQGLKNVGFDNEADGGAVRDAVEAQIFDLYLLKYWAIKFASNAACTVLQVDQKSKAVNIYTFFKIICAKPATGPKTRAPKGQDEDD